MIAMERANDDKLQKTLVCLELKTTTQIPDEYKQCTKNLSTRFGVMFYDDKIIVPKSLRTTVITSLRKGHPSINKTSHAAKPFWWARMHKEIQQKCDECISCNRTGKNIKSQLTMTEVNYLPPTKKPNQGIQLDFIGPRRPKQRRFFMLVSTDRYSRWPAACICETPTDKTAKSFLEQYINLIGISETIGTDEGTAFSGNINVVKT